MTDLTHYIGWVYVMLFGAKNSCIALVSLDPIRSFVKAKDGLDLSQLCAIADSSVVPVTCRSLLDCGQQCHPASIKNDTDCVGFNYVKATRSCSIFKQMPNFQTVSGCSFFGVSLHLMWAVLECILHVRGNTYIKFNRCIWYLYLKYIDWIVFVFAY